MSAAVPRPRLSARPGGAGSQSVLLVCKIINAPIAPEYQSFLSNISFYLGVCQPVVERMVRGQAVREFVTLPSRVARLFLNSSGRLGLPPLRGICSGPLLADDGSIRCGARYDRGTGFWCVSVDVPPIPERPTFENAQESLRLIRSMFVTFPFADAKRVGSNAGSVIDLAKPP